MKLSAKTPINPTDASYFSEGSPLLHQSFAEQGKLYFLEEKFDLALKYFRYSLELAVQTESPEFLIKHYLECLLEALEMTGNYQAVLAYCDRFISLVEQEDFNAERQIYLAQVFQKKGIVLIKSGKKAEGQNFLDKASKLAASGKFPLLLTENILFLLNSGIVPNKTRILQEQKQAGYFFINPKNVNKEIALQIK